MPSAKQIKQLKIDLKHSDILQRYGRRFALISNNCCNLSEEFIEFYINKLDLTLVIKHNKLSENFIDKYANKLNWYALCKYQNLTEYILDKYSTRLNWPLVCKYQHLTESFIAKYKDKIVWSNLKMNTKIPYHELIKFCNKYEN